jgi:hypothetical protein
MGCGASAPKTGGGGAAAPGARTAPETADDGLSAVGDPSKFLGRGGTGDTWLFR